MNFRMWMELAVRMAGMILLYFSAEEAVALVNLGAGFAGLGFFHTGAVPSGPGVPDGAAYAGPVGLDPETIAVTGAAGVAIGAPCSL
jgi:hypothetical protein